MVLYLNGKFIPESEACIPVADRGFLFGDGVFTTVKVNDGQPEFLQKHVQKLERDCALVGIDMQPISEAIISRLIQENQAEKGIWRLKIILTGGGSSEINLKRKSDGLLLITLKPYLGNAPIIKICRYPIPICQPFDKAKTLSYLSRLMVADYAIRQGFDDALVCSPEGFILDTSTANFFWKEGKNLYFPDPSLAYYLGVTLQTILEASEELRCDFVSQKIKPQEIPEHAQLYLCNSMKGVIPVICIEDKIYPRDQNFESKVFRLLKKNRNDNL